MTWEGVITVPVTCWSLYLTVDYVDTTIMANVKTLKVRVPKRIVRDIDRVVGRGFFISRNEAIREAIREQLDELKKEKRK